MLNCVIGWLIGWNKQYTRRYQSIRGNQY